MVAAAAVVLPEDFDVLGIDDSKKLSEKKREKLFPVIKEKAIAFGIGMVDNKVIDDINILQATKKAMTMAVDELNRMLEANGSRQTDYILFDAMKIDDIKIPQESVIKGDAKVLAIAAASIIAKVTRDRIMSRVRPRNIPGTVLKKNKGYGTKQHYEGIKKQGICPIHRKTFLKKVL